MEGKRKAVVFYRNFYEAVKELPVELRTEVYDAIMEYGLNGEEPSNLSLIAKSIFALIKPSIDTNNTRYENGKNGGRPKKNTEQTKSKIVKTEEKPNQNQIEIKQEPTNNINNEYENNNDNIIQEDEPPLVLSVSKEERISYDRIVKKFNDELTPILPKVVAITDGRKNAIKSMYNKHGPEAIDTVFQKVKSSQFLQGFNDRGFKCNFDWIFKPSNFIKILEGNYDNDNRASNLSDKQRANQAALDQFMSNYRAEPNMALQVERPF